MYGGPPEGYGMAGRYESYSRKQKPKHKPKHKPKAKANSKKNRSKSQKLLFLACGCGFWLLILALLSAVALTPSFHARGHRMEPHAHLLKFEQGKIISAKSCWYYQLSYQACAVAVTLVPTFWREGHLRSWFLQIACSDMQC